MDKFLSKMGVVESDGKGCSVMAVEDVDEWKLYKTFFAGHCAAVHISYIILCKELRIPSTALQSEFPPKFGNIRLQVTWSSSCT